MAGASAPVNGASSSLSERTVASAVQRRRNSRLPCTTVMATGPSPASSTVGRGGEEVPAAAALVFWCLAGCHSQSRLIGVCRSAPLPPSMEIVQ